jgi:hypothetical protein
MAKLFEHERLVPAWLAVSRHLDSRTAADRTDRNLVLEISDPTALTPADLQAFEKVDVALRSNPRMKGLNVKTVAGTIFPAALYQRHGRTGMYTEFNSIMARAKESGTWGTYAMRMMAWPANKNGQPPINQLEQTIIKLDRAAHGGHPFQSAFEVGIVPPESLSEEAMLMPCEVSTFDPAIDGRKPTGMPCLSHLSFKMTDKEAVDLTAVYRSHHYAARALGNLLGLSQLLEFVAKESKLKVGTLTCISSHAELDVISWGGAPAAHVLLASL